ncbi:cation:proton antiporter [Leptolyngbya sp. BC1307]|uniref:cation:proton antiporter domain-containing protein n=1 Tax=Leptolyngbya sp. BC1307 TaxID=2029589 RepID=UPI000EFDAFC2|nr:cation:proton antiporter [Leptolyngbya sp. BC1307]
MFLFLMEPAAETLQAPIATFVLLLAIVLITPPLFERVKLPGLVGLIAAGVVFGGSGLGWLNADSDTMKLLSEIGKIYLMFVAGLEIDLILFQRTRDRSMGYGFLTFAIPLAGGIGVGLLFGFGWLAAVLIGSLLASHTLLAYPIIQRLGVVDDEAVTVTVGATIFTDIGSLLVLAICLGINQGDFSAVKLLTLLGSLGLYAIAVLIGLKQLGKLFFRKVGKDEANRFLFVLLSVFLSAVVAQLIGVENIIGAFLAGLAINSVVGDGPVKEKTEFLGSVLFIPMFFVNMGLLLDLEAFGDILASIGLPLLIVGMLLATKLLAALAARQLYQYSWIQTWAMWSLSIPQVAATLAAALVGYQAEIINTEVFNSVILLMLVTAILGPLVTTYAAGQLALQKTFDDSDSVDWLPPPSDVPDSFAVVVPVYNPENERSLIELAAAVAQYANGRVIPLAVALAQPEMDSPQLTKAVTRSRQRLEEAQAIGDEFETTIDPRLRIDYSVAQAISHISREESANLIVLGLARQSRIGRQLFNSIQDEVMRAAHCPVVVAKLLNPPATFKTILIPIENPSVMTLRVLRFAQVLAIANQAKITLLHVCSPRTSEIHRTRLKKQLEILVDRLPPGSRSINIELLVRENVVSAIAKAARSYDLVIVRSQRRRSSNGLTMGANTTPLLEQLPGSTILVGEPHPQLLRQPVRSPMPSPRLSAAR